MFPFGSSTTTNPTTPSTGSLFGQTASQQATTQPATGFFGSKPTTTTTQSTFQTGGFGQANKSIFGQPTLTTGSGFGQSNQLNSTFGGFGSKPATTTSSSFSFGSQQPTTQTTNLQGQSILGQSSTTGSASFGISTGLGLQAPTSLNTTTASSGLSNQPSTTATLQVDDLFTLALINPQAFNDERDTILSKWNQLQSFYGYGKVFYQNSSIDVNKDNKYTRFKTIGYSCIPSNKEEDGLVALIINQKEDFVKTNKKNIQDTLNKIFNNDQSLIINISSIKPSADSKTELVFYVEQKQSALTQETKRVSSVLVFNHLNKQETTSGSLLGGLGASRPPSSKQLLEQISVTNFYPMVGLTDEQIKNYLDNPPAGIDPALWDQAKKNNPNPKKLMPLPITGFQEIHKRFKLQDDENTSHKASLSVIKNSIDELDSRNKLILNKIDQFKARNEDLEQRVLKLIINYEIRRKIGIPLQENEKYLLNILDNFQVDLNSPINKEIRRQKLNEFIEIIKSFELANANRSFQQSTLNKLKQTNTLSSDPILSDPNNLAEMQKSLREQHKALKSLIDVINKDMKDLNSIKKDLFNAK